MQCVDSDSDKVINITEYSGVPIPYMYQHCIWRRRDPTPQSYVIYAFIVPALAFFGLCANFINAIVFMRPKMTPSAFTYLAALSFLDCSSCLLITLTALSRSIFHNRNVWIIYDFQWQTPLFGITTGAANLILAFVSCDRLIYLWNGIPCGKATPSFCRRTVAKRITCMVIIFSLLVNVPYFFVFVVNEDNTIEITDFYCSQYYRLHNWFTFLILTVLPAIFLMIGNTAIIIAFRRWTKQSKICQQSCSNNLKTTQKRYLHQMKLTITITIVITLYMIGELPAHLTSRKSALNLLYGGDITKVNFELMERLEIICITLNALQLSLNIIIYAVINPSFVPEFFVCLRGASDVCFRIFCLTALVNCWHWCCQRKGSGRESIEEMEQSPPAQNHNNNNNSSNTTADCWSVEQDMFINKVNIDNTDKRNQHRCNSNKTTQCGLDNLALEVEVTSNITMSSSQRNHITISVHNHI